MLAAHGPRGSQEVFFVGERGLVLRFDGRSWERLTPPTRATLWWVWVASSTEVWVVGDAATVLLFDGQRFTAVPSGLDDRATVYGVWGATPEDVWLVGGHPQSHGPGFALRGNRHGFAPASGLTVERDLFKVWGVAGDDVWLVGDEGRIVHFDGHRFAQRRLGRDRLVTVTGRGPRDVWIVGGGVAGVVYHDAGEGPVFAGEAGTSPLAGAWTAAGEELLVVGLRGTVRRRVGDAWIRDRVDPTLDLHAAFGLGAGQAFAVGGELLGGAPRGTILHRGATALAPFALPAVAPGEVPVGGADGGPSPPPADLAVVGGAGEMAPRADGGLIPPGQPCPQGSGCGPGAECWWIMGARLFLCTEPCTTVDDCGARYGPDPRCAPPGCQALGFPRCLPRGLVGCAP